MNAFAASGLQLQRSPVPASADGLDYVHFPIGGSANDLVVTVFGTEQAAGSYEQASRGGLPAAVKVKAVERVRNVVLVINDAASASTERAARDALARLS